MYNIKIYIYIKKILCKPINTTYIFTNEIVTGHISCLGKAEQKSILNVVLKEGRLKP